MLYPKNHILIKIYYTLDKIEYVNGEKGTNAEKQNFLSKFFFLDTIIITVWSKV